MMSGVHSASQLMISWLKKIINKSHNKISNEILRIYVYRCVLYSKAIEFGSYIFIRMIAEIILGHPLGKNLPYSVRLGISQMTQCPHCTLDQKCDGKSVTKM